MDKFIGLTFANEGDVRLLLDMILVDGEGYFTNLTVFGAGQGRENILDSLEPVYFSLLLWSFQNSFFEFVLFKIGGGPVILLNQVRLYLVAWDYEGRSIEFFVSQESWNNRFRRWSQTVLENSIPHRRGEIDQNRLIVAPRRLANKCKLIVRVNGCLVFWHWNYIYSVVPSNN